MLFSETRLRAWQPLFTSSFLMVVFLLGGCLANQAIEDVFSGPGSYDAWKRKYDEITELLAEAENLELIVVRRRATIADYEKFEDVLTELSESLNEVVPYAIAVKETNVPAIQTLSSLQGVADKLLFLGEVRGDERVKAFALQVNRSILEVCAELKIPNKSAACSLPEQFWRKNKSNYRAPL